MPAVDIAIRPSGRSDSLSSSSTASSFEEVPEFVPVAIIGGGSDDGDNESSSSSTAGECDDRGQSAKDAVIDFLLGDFTLPDADLMGRIVDQVEAYFSDTNLAKDAFLLKHIRRNKDGYVSLKLVASFRKIKAINKNWKVVAYSIINGSNKLEINELFSKVRRINPLPEFALSNELPVTRSIIAYNLPFEKPSIENVSELFSSHGEVALIRILRPGGSVPNDLKSIMQKHTQLGSSICAVVEFEKPEVAQKILDFHSNGDNWRSRMNVMPLVTKSSNVHLEIREDPKKKRVRRDRFGSLNSSAGHDGDSLCVSSCSESELVQCRPRSKTAYNFVPKANPVHMPRPQYSNQYRPKSTSYSFYESHNDQRPPLSYSPPSSNCSSSQSSPSHFTKMPCNLVRLPRGPDGTRGFQMRITKIRSQSEPFALTCAA